MDDEIKDTMPSEHTDYKPVNRFDATLAECIRTGFWITHPT